MRGVAALLALAPVLVAAAPAAPASKADVAAARATLAGIHGHWSCETAAGTVERSYSSPIRKDGAPEPVIYGRADGSISGVPVTSFERIDDNEAGSLQIESPDGTATLASVTPNEVRFSGTTLDGLSLVQAYAFDGTTMHRTTDAGGKRVGDERCSREPDAPATTGCAQPNAAAFTKVAVEPEFPAEAYRERVSGTVLVLVTLDDRSQVMWTDIYKSPSPLFDQPSIDVVRRSTFQTMVRDCKPVAATFVFGVEFRSQ